MTELREYAQHSTAWPFAEARLLLKHVGDKVPAKGYVLFETGYGPSGLPHIGTFGEVARTSMVRHAFSLLSDLPTKLFAFSDDMDGLRKVPDNIPNQEMVAEHLGKPLTEIPDPFGMHESFGHHNNARLKAFLDDFGFDYEFKSSTECYKSGEFDAALAAGVRLEEFLGQLVECCRDLMVVAAGAESIGLQSVGPASHERLVALATQWGLETAIAALQVLGETLQKSRGTRQSRALADLALVRIATLEKLQELEGLVASLVASPGEPAADSRQKKTPQIIAATPVSSESMPSEPVVTEPVSIPETTLQEDSGIEADEADETIPLQSGRETAVWQRVVGEISDILHDHITCVDRVAISGPNRLDLVFPAGYHFQKQFCERPEMLQRLQGLLRNVTGQVVHLRMLVDETEPKKAVEATEEPESEVELGGLVQEAQDVFGATVERVIPVPRGTGQQDE